MGKAEKIIILLLLFIFMMLGIRSRDMYQFGGESLVFLIYLGWFISSFNEHKE